MRSNAARRRALRLPYDHGEPIWRCRYDVIAAAFIAFFVAITAVPLTQVRTHALVVDLPVFSFLDTSGTLAPHYVQHVIAPQSDGTVFWDDEIVSQEELLTRLQRTRSRDIEPEIFFAPNREASYDLSLKTLALMRLSGVNRVCIANTERYRSFGSGREFVRLNLTLVGPIAAPTDYEEPELVCTTLAIIQH